MAAIVGQGRERLAAHRAVSGLGNGERFGHAGILIQRSANHNHGANGNYGAAAAGAAWVWAIVTVMAAISEQSWRPGIIVVLFVPIFHLARLGARTIHAFIQGVNEGDDPCRAKRPPLDP